MVSGNPETNADTITEGLKESRKGLVGLPIMDKCKDLIIADLSMKRRQSVGYKILHPSNR